jgi:hypothetical protein
MLDVPGSDYWTAWDHFVRAEVATRGLVDPDDHALYRITDDVEDASGEILGFYRNYHSRRFVGPLMLIRLQHAPSDAELNRLNEEFADICVSGRIERTDPLPPEVSDNDHLDLPRIAFVFDQIHHARLRMLIDTLNLMPTPA